MAEESKVSVRTYVPESQKEIWEDHAEDLDMSLSEFLRTMVQAGRNDFQLQQSSPSDGSTMASTLGSEGQAMREQIVMTLEERGPMGWDDLVDELLGNVEDEIEDVLLDLQDSNRVQHRPRQGDYTIVA